VVRKREEVPMAALILPMLLIWFCREQIRAEIGRFSWFAKIPDDLIESEMYG
jgi:hypothetical protein